MKKEFNPEERFGQECPPQQDLTREEASMIQQKIAKGTASGSENLRFAEYIRKQRMLDNMP